MNSEMLLEELLTSLQNSDLAEVERLLRLPTSSQVSARDAWRIFETVLAGTDDAYIVAEAIDRNQSHWTNLEEWQVKRIVGMRARHPQPPTWLDSRSAAWFDDCRRAFQQYSLEDTLETSLQLERSSRFVEDSQVLVMADQALSAGRSFSYIRIGDGEGRLLWPSGMYRSLDQERDAIANRVWLWNSRVSLGAGLVARAKAAFAHCDVVGFNPAHRIRLEWRNSVVGYLGCAAANRWIAAERSQGLVARNWALAGQDEAGVLAPWLDGRKVLAITPYVDFLAVLNASAGSSAIRVPSEGHPAVSPGSRSEPHFPDVYAQVVSELRSLEGICVLVASGLLGKIYCDVASASGGVSLDIGSLADKWMGIVTR